MNTIFCVYRPLYPESFGLEVFKIVPPSSSVPVQNYVFVKIVKTLYKSAKDKLDILNLMNTEQKINTANSTLWS